MVHVLFQFLAGIVAALLYMDGVGTKYPVILVQPFLLAVLISVSIWLARKL